jgi:hypothetical protein
MKRFFRWINEQIVWLTSKRVLQALNDGATYEELYKIVEEEMER